jgi:hypothetical protein
LAEKIELLAPTIELSKLKSNIFAEIIDRIGFSWDHWFGLLMRFKEREGHCLVPRFHDEGQFKLGAWVAEQRTNYRKDNLSVDRKRRLDDLGFVWNTHANAWQEGFAALTAFIAREGHCSPPQRYKEEKFSLGRWVHTQRRERISNRLSAERQLQLDKIGFVWNPLEEAWEEGFTLLRSFKEREGHCDPSPRLEENGFKLGQWVRNQRAERWSMPDERRRRLDEIGFVWTLNEDAWQQGFAALSAFKNREGHCSVPNSHIENGYPLGRWVGTQRLTLDGYGNRRPLSQDRRQRLAELGFVWDKLDGDWEEGFSHLKIYREREGHSRVPHDHLEGHFRLGQWARANRDRLSKSSNLQGSLYDERWRRLEELGFAWSLVDAAWEEGFNRLKTYRDREGHCRVPRFHTEDAFRLGMWVASQRSNKDALSKQQRERLNGLVFVWDPLETAWDHAIECLKRFKERAGHCEVPIDYRVNGFRLGKWVSRQRQKRDKLTEQRRQQLNELGFTWKVRRCSPR